MYTKISTTNMERKEWLRKRKEGIGGSDAGAICGLNPYVSPLRVYQDKTSSEIPEYDNEAMRQGRELEDYVAKRFMEAAGCKVRRSNAMYQSTEYPFMLADVDRLVVGEDAGLECKTASAFQADQWKNGKIPPHYLIQCLHYMAVTGRTSWYLAVIILGREFRYIKIARDESMIKNLIAIEREFWEEHVIPGILPDPDGSSVCDEIIRAFYPRADRKEILLPSEFNPDLKRREEIIKLLEKLEMEKSQIEQKLKLFLGDCEMAQNSSYQICWSNVDSIRLDGKRLKEEYPELYQQFSRTSHSRRFAVRVA